MDLPPVHMLVFSTKRSFLRSIMAVARETFLAIKSRV
jgi:hypothetical protein